MAWLVQNSMNLFRSYLFCNSTMDAIRSSDRNYLFNFGKNNRDKCRERFVDEGVNIYTGMDRKEDQYNLSLARRTRMRRHTNKICLEGYMIVEVDKTDNFFRDV